MIWITDDYGNETMINQDYLQVVFLEYSLTKKRWQLTAYFLNMNEPVIIAEVKNKERGKDLLELITFMERNEKEDDSNQH